MTAITVAARAAGPLLLALADATLPAPVTTEANNAGPRVFTWTPDLSAADEASVQSMLRLVIGVTLITATERAALDPAITEIRALRTRTSAQWTALTAAQRDTDTIAWCRDITDVLRAMLRDG